MNGVYSPLYQYFVKQELVSEIYSPDRDYKESPILEIKKTKTNSKWKDGKLSTTIETTVLFNLSREDFLKVKSEINLGLISQELLTLLNMYEVLVYMEGKYDNGTDEQVKAAILKVKVESAIRKEVFTGYKKYYKLLGLKKLINTKMWKLTNEHIQYTLPVSNEEIETLKKDMHANPEKY